MAKLIGDVNSAAKTINRYAALMGYLSMAIKGLGILILTWTTAVLLGGFVSALRYKDFWCLTFITLVTAVQTAGIFDVCLNERLGYILSSAYNLFRGSLSAFSSKNVLQEDRPENRLSPHFIDKAPTTSLTIQLQEDRTPVTDKIWAFLARVYVVIQMLVLAMLVCPLTAVYMFGGFISTGVSLLRLTQGDYGGTSDEQANLKPAMDTLYCLASLQGVLFFYRFIFGHVGKMMVKDFIPTCGYDELEGVRTYLSEIRIECEKNPSFAIGRNFITHAVDLVGSKSPDECLSGVRLLYTAICIGERELKEAILKGEETIGQHMLMKTMIMSASSSPILQKVLLQTLNPRHVFGREMRNKAARIVAYLALDIHLEQFPWGIQYISSLIGTFEEYRLIKSYLNSNDDVGDWEDHGKLVLRGLCILRKLATYENNCKIMSETQGLLPRIMVPLTSDLIHQFSAGTWSIRVVEGSLKVMRLLVAAPGEIGARIRGETSNNKDAIRTMETIFRCRHCDVKLRTQAMGVLIQLYVDTESSPAFIKILVDIFASDNTDGSIRKLAGEALGKLCLQRGSNTCSILQLDGAVVGRLTKILLDDKNKTCKIRAAEILEHMCNIHHTKDDECISKFKKAMTSTMPKVLAKLLGDKLAKDEIHARPEPDQLEILVEENQYNEDKTSSCTHPKYYKYKAETKVEEEDRKYWGEDVELEEDEPENDEYKEFCAPLLSLCVTVCDTFISADQDLQFDPIILPKKLNEMVINNSVRKVCCLRLMKVTCKMVISMMKHNDKYVQKDLNILIRSLTRASRRMRHLDASMVFAMEDNGSQTTKPIRSLVSLVKEAEESVETRMATNAHDPENIMEPSTSGPPPMGDTD